MVQNGNNVSKWLWCENDFHYGTKWLWYEMTIIPLDQCLSTKVKSTAQLQASGCFTLIFVYICMFILRFTDSDYSFGILKLFFLYTYMYHPGVAEFLSPSIFTTIK